ncbi:response regulator [Clostridium gelidum]|uniref:Stage 0 sporulation protein A homolog n=1 Tax=Clostridium gelidum TaxID=704125 RepID=A0ABN6ITV0_9CLOT|nr:response regulator [Clostridium gelidum]BCZ45625.1 response regulator [Clostridium gelidum]
MKILIVEDDLSSRKFLYKFMSNYGDCDITVDGMEGLDAYLMALDEGEHYDLICLDIMMPKVDGVKVLKTIREMEKQRGIEGERKVKIIMTTALNDVDLVKNSFDSGCEVYANKPIDIKKLENVMEKLNFKKKI